MSILPPLATSGVFSVGASILIDAPREKVWQILIDLPSYGKWNPFTRSMTVVSKFGSALDDQTLAVGRLFVSAVNIPPGMTPPRMSGTSLVTTLEHDNFRSAWVTPPGFWTWFMSVERWTMLTIEDGKTKWETIEVFKGIGAYIVYWLLYKNFLVSLRSMGEALKSASETV